jgi:hypothetical protein
MRRRAQPALGGTARIERVDIVAEAMLGAQRGALGDRQFSLVNIASTPSPISFSTSPPAS